MLMNFFMELISVSVTNVMVGVMYRHWGWDCQDCQRYQYYKLWRRCRYWVWPCWYCKCLKGSQWWQRTLANRSKEKISIYEAVGIAAALVVLFCCGMLCEILASTIKVEWWIVSLPLIVAWAWVQGEQRRALCASFFLYGVVWASRWRFGDT